MISAEIPAAAAAAADICVVGWLCSEGLPDVWALVCAMEGMEGYFLILALQVRKPV